MGPLARQPRDEEALDILKGPALQTFGVLTTQLRALGKIAQDGGLQAREESSAIQTSVLYGNLGNDVLDGGPGTDDSVHYQHAAQGLAVDLAAGTGTGDGSDTIANVERAQGSRFSDRLLGSAAANTFIGLEGNDTIDGRTGVDMVKYTTDINHPINANLTTRTATGVGHGTDRLLNIENLGGTLLDDILVGDGGPNFLGGRVGNDILAGMGGADTLQGGGDVYPGPDNDVVLGGDGDDVLDGNEGNDVLDGGPGANSGDGGTGTDVCFNVVPATNCT